MTSDEPTRRTFVAGATGYTGRAVVRELVSRDVETVAHVRPDSAYLAEWGERFRAEGARTDATRWDEDALAATLDRLRPTHVFALLGTTRARGRRARKQGREESYDTVDYGLTATLLRATRRGSPDARFVYLSALGVGEDEPRNAYLRARWKVERELRDGDVAWLVARPSFITGPDRDERRAGERIAAATLDGLLGMAGWLGLRRVRDRYRSIRAGELARGLVTLALAGGENRVVSTEELRARDAAASDTGAGAGAPSVG